MGIYGFFHPQESLGNIINTMGTRTLGVHPSLSLDNQWHLPTYQIFFQVTAREMHMAVAFIATPASSKAKWAALPAQAATAPSQLVSWTMTWVWWLEMTLFYTLFYYPSSCNHGSGKWPYCRGNKPWGNSFPTSMMGGRETNVDILRRKSIKNISKVTSTLHLRGVTISKVSCWVQILIFLEILHTYLWEPQLRKVVWRMFCLLGWIILPSVVSQRPITGMEMTVRIHYILATVIYEQLDKFFGKLQENCNTPPEHTPGNPRSQLWKESLYSLLAKVV